MLGEVPHMSSCLVLGEHSSEGCFGCLLHQCTLALVLVSLLAVVLQHHGGWPVDAEGNYKADSV